MNIKIDYDIFAKITNTSSIRQPILDGCFAHDYCAELIELESPSKLHLESHFPEQIPLLSLVLAASTSSPSNIVWPLELSTISKFPCSSLMTIIMHDICYSLRTCPSNLLCIIQWWWQSPYIVVCQAVSLFTLWYLWSLMHAFSFSQYINLIQVIPTNCEMENANI